MSSLSLPTLVFGRPEVHRLQRELEALEQYLEQASLRAKGAAATLPRASRLLEALATENHLNFLQAEDRTTAKAFLKMVSDKAPTIHMSFASDPSSAFMAKMVEWLRGNVHPLALLQIGLQPSIAAGCIVRTPNKTFDLSLRERLRSQQDKLAEALKGAMQ
ncbi:MAG TPA: hypothetical protein VIM53_00650 [Candidatus Saccharimonadales bacterium]